MIMDLKQIYSWGVGRHFHDTKTVQEKHVCSCITCSLVFPLHSSLCCTPKGGCVLSCSMYQRWAPDAWWLQMESAISRGQMGAPKWKLQALFSLRLAPAQSTPVKSWRRGGVGPGRPYSSSRCPCSEQLPIASRAGTPSRGATCRKFRFLYPTRERLFNRISA